MAGVRSGGGPRILGLTGPIGCGKTTVGDILLELGAIERIDADRVVHGLMSPGGPAVEPVHATFGEDFIAPDGSVDRARLGTVVFANEAKLRALEAIVHPLVRREIRRRVEELRAREGVIVIDAVRLLQSDLLPLTHAVWVVTCKRAVELERLTGRRGMTPEEAERRLAAQPPFEGPRVTRVIENSGSLHELRDAVEAAWAEFVPAL